MIQGAQEMMSQRLFSGLMMSACVFAVAGCGGGVGLGGGNGNNVNDNENVNQGPVDGGAGDDGAVTGDSGPGPDAEVTSCDPVTDDCCDPDGTPCDHGCDGTSCFPECDPGADPCCDPDGTACDHGCDGADCYPECDPGVDPCCNPDGTRSDGGHDVCALGGPLDPACDTCAEAVCQVDAYCCNTEWDLMCFDQVLTECGVDCAAGVLGCDDQYGSVAGYIGCAEGGGTCSFSTSTVSGSCAALCSARGGECVDAYNNDGDCGLAEQTGCNHVGYATEICICSRGCGADDPCTPPAVCQSGQCL